MLINHSWLVVSTPLKNISQWEGLSRILWKIKNVWNHQPEIGKHLQPYIQYFHPAKWGHLSEPLKMQHFKKSFGRLKQKKQRGRFRSPIHFVKMWVPLLINWWDNDATKLQKSARVQYPLSWAACLINISENKHTFLTANHGDRWSSPFLGSYWKPGNSTIWKTFKANRSHLSSVQNPCIIPLYWLVKNGIYLLDYCSPQYIG